VEQEVRRRTLLGILPGLLLMAAAPALAAEKFTTIYSAQPQELIDNRFLEDIERSGFFDQVWAKR